MSDRGIFVASIDIYRPQFGAGATENQAFDWDRQPNRFEQLIARFFDNGQRAYVVEGISVDIAAAFTLKMRGGYFLEVFPNNSALDIEYWRLFEPRKDKPHFVVEGGGASD